MKVKIEQILGELCGWKQVNIIEVEGAEMSTREIEKVVLKASKYNRSRQSYIHMLVEILE